MMFLTVLRLVNSASCALQSCNLPLYCSLQRLSFTRVANIEHAKLFGGLHIPEAQKQHFDDFKEEICAHLITYNNILCIAKAGSTLGTVARFICIYDALLCVHEFSNALLQVQVYIYGSVKASWTT